MPDERLSAPSLPRAQRRGARRRAIAALCAALAAVGCARGTSGAAASASPSTGGIPGMEAIVAEELRRDLFAMAGDGMRGREAGTLDEMRATVWVAERAREAGLEPAGEDGTYFQWWPIRRTRLSEGSQIAIGDHKLRLWRDAVVLNAGSTIADLPIVWVGDAPDAELAKLDLKGKAVAALVASEAPNSGPATLLTNVQRSSGTAVRARAAALAQAGAAAAILFSADASLDAGFDANATVLARGSYGIDSAGAPAGAYARPNARATAMAAASRPTPVPTLWVRRELLDIVRAPGAKLTANVYAETFYYPSANVVARVRGTDPGRANEYVLFSAHQDHDGTRYAVGGDSIWNGADDNATVSVALLAAGRAFAKRPAARPILFVWHGAEERGLLGSRWFASHPLVPLSSIVAVLNGDMIGRNAPDSAALLGAQPPHRNSVALVDAALRANDQITHFKLDTLWDRESHPEGWYYRSDHLPYARLGVPAIMFSTLLHPDYHTVRDEPARIDIAKLTRMTQWMYATGRIVADAPQRPDAAPGFVLPR